MRVWAVKGTGSAPRGISATIPCAAASSTTETPSGVGSACDDSDAYSARSGPPTPSSGTNADARRLP